MKRSSLTSRNLGFQNSSGSPVYICGKTETKLEPLTISRTLKKHFLNNGAGDALQCPEPSWSKLKLNKELHSQRTLTSKLQGSVSLWN